VQCFSSHRYATAITDAETGERIDVLPYRTAPTLTARRREHPGAEYVCRDGSGSYGDSPGPWFRLDRG
jgi:transposase